VTFELYCCAFVVKSLCISVLCCRWMLLLTETLCYFDSLLTHYQAKGMSIPGINNPGLSSYIVDRSKHLMRRVSEWAVPTRHVYAWVVLHFSKQLLVLSTDSVSVLRRLCCFQFSAYISIAFSALTLLVGRQEEHLACKNWVIRCWCGYMAGARCRLFAYGPADATASQNPIISCLI